MYPIVLTLHNVMRWVVLVLAVLALLRGLTGWFGRKPWAPAAAGPGPAGRLLSSMRACVSSTLNRSGLPPARAMSQTSRAITIWQRAASNRTSHSKIRSCSPMSAGRGWLNSTRIKGNRWFVAIRTRRNTAASTYSAYGRVIVAGRDGASAANVTPRIALVCASHCDSLRPVRASHSKSRQRLPSKLEETNVSPVGEKQTAPIA